MFKRSWFWVWVFSANLWLQGCQEPSQIMNAVPPGVDPRALTEEKENENDKPEALGESVNNAGRGDSSKPVSDLVPAPPTAKGEVKTTPSGVKYETIKEGTGAVAKAGQRVTVHYVGTLEDGKKFDSTRDRNKPAPFTIGTGSVIKGWDEAVPGMKIGEIRSMTIPPNAGYGAIGKGPVPPNATLKFEVELLEVH
ncbi:MAG: hypothetical protein NVSMB9_06910 [Isosphaeraceae bacterium]